LAGCRDVEWWRPLDSGLECVRKPLAHALALRKQMIALAKWTKAR